jgi:RND family efflux transporter MFP subunit
MKSASIGRCVKAAVSCLVTMNLAAAVRAAEPTASTTIRTVVGITQPSEQRKLVFPAQGIVKEMLVKEGDEVKKGQLLAKLDDEADLKELSRLKIDAESVARIEAAEADLKAKTLKFERLKKAAASGAAGQGEVDEAEADMITRDKQLKVAKDEFAQAKFKYEQQLVRCDRMQLKSTVNGSVQKVFIGEGEFNDPQRQDGAIFVVQNDPLKIEIRELKTRQVATLRRGDKLDVHYVNDAPEAWQQAEVTFIAPMADAPSDKQMVQLSMPNPKNRSSGLHMEVKLTPKLIETAPSDETALTP